MYRLNPLSVQPPNTTPNPPGSDVWHFAGETADRLRGSRCRFVANVRATEEGMISGEIGNIVVVDDDAIRAGWVIARRTTSGATGYVHGSYLDPDT